MTLQQAFAATFKKFKRRAELTNPEIINITGLGKATIHNLTAEHGYPEVETIFKVCPALGVTEAAFMTEVRKLCSDFGYENLPEDPQQSIKLSARDNQIAEKLEELLGLLQPGFELDIRDLPAYQEALNAMIKLKQNM